MMHRKFTLSGLGLSLMIATLSANAAGLTSTHSAFGTNADGVAIEKYTLSNSHGMQASIITWGGVLQSLIVPDKNGKPDDVVLGFDDIQGYQANPSVYFGATIGRFGNRIAKGKFTLDGTEYQVPTNDGPNSCTVVLKASINAFGKPRPVKKKVGWA